VPLSPEDSAGFLLWHVTLRWQRQVTAALAPLGLTHVQFVLLACTWWLNRDGTRPSQVAVARQAGTDVKMTSQVVRTLEAKGLVTRDVDPADSRARRLSVTDTGAALAQKSIAVVERIDAAFFARAPDRAAVLGLLATLAEPDA
jgi:DNA-binding MarR family transcriptional regulator